MGIVIEDFGTTPDGRAVQQYVITNPRGLSMEVLTYGGIVRRLLVPDARGRQADVVLGCDSVEQYLQAGAYLGALIGRYANRIAAARFWMHGMEYRLPPNEGRNQLHGGPNGFDKVLWEAEALRTHEGDGVRLRYVSPDGEGGFPGTLAVTVDYLLTQENALRVTYEATSEESTPVNLTQHSYFNLAGHDAGDVLGHVVRLDAGRYLPVDDDLLPTGEIREVEGTPLDFREPKEIGRDLADAGGFDHCYVLDHHPGELRLVAEVHEPASGRTLTMLTTEPGVQFYSGNSLAGQEGKGQVSYAPHAGFCLEAQHYPDSPNRPEFPSTILRRGEVYRQTTEYRFAART